MNAAAEIREEYKSAVGEYVRYRDTPRKEFYEGRMSGLEVALSVLGVDSDEIREMFKLREEEELNEIAEQAATDTARIQQAATDAANQLQREKEEEEQGA